MVSVRKSLQLEENVIVDLDVELRVSGQSHIGQIQVNAGKRLSRE
jgi:hypothetical protein